MYVYIYMQLDLEKSGEKMKNLIKYQNSKNQDKTTRGQQVLMQNVKLIHK